MRGIGGVWSSFSTWRNHYSEFTVTSWQLKHLKFKCHNLLDGSSGTVLKPFQRKLRMVCQNTLFADEKLESNRQTNSSQKRFLDIFAFKLQLFAPRNTGIADQMITCFATRFKSIFLFPYSFFNIFVPPRCSFLTIRRHFLTLSSTAFKS